LLTLKIWHIMKHTNKLLALLLLVSMGVLSSCSDDEAKLAKKITIDGESITLENGYIVGMGSGLDDNEEPASLYNIVLTDGDITVDGGQYFGTGTAMIIYVVSPLTYDLKNGTYTFEFSESFETNKAFAFVNYNWNTDTEEAEEGYSIIVGTLKITRSGNTFKITMSKLVLERNSDSAEVEGKGSWEGSLDDKALIGIPL
jgi:hypothetical protein